MTQAQALRLPQADGREFAGFGATIREIVSGLATEHTWRCTRRLRRLCLAKI